MDTLVSAYTSELKLQASKSNLHHISDGVHVSSVSGLSLEEYVFARKEYCANSHEQPCEQCHRMLKVAGTVLKEGFCLLSDAFRIVSPTVGYTAERARRKFTSNAPCSSSNWSGISWKLTHSSA